MSGIFEREIHEQPDALERQLTNGREAAVVVAEKVKARAPSSIVIAARGSSDNAGRYAQYLLGAHNRLAVSLATPSLFTLYNAPPSLAGSVVVGISQSGRSPDIVEVVAEGRRQGSLTIAITNDTASPLAQAAELCLPLHAGPEHAVAATKTYTTQLTALAMLSCALSDDAARWDELSTAPAMLRETLARNTASARDAAARLAGIKRFVTIGRGFNYASAFEVSLKMKETCYVVAEPYSSADFRHGPTAMLEHGLGAVLIAPSGKVFADVAALAELCAERAVDVVAISDRAELLDAAQSALPLPTGMPEWLSPLAAIVPGQLLSLELARARGIDLDNPRGLTKITETR